MSDTTESLQKQIIAKLGLEETPSGQLKPANIEDFDSDWTITVQNLVELVIAYSKEREREAYDQGYEDGENAKPPSLKDAIQFRQEQYGWNDSKMAAMLDLSRAHFSEFKSGKRGLPVNSIRKAYAIGIPADVLLADQVIAALSKPTENK